jgi:Fe2+ or Zn2+ uptake regulation protein
MARRQPAIELIRQRLLATLANGSTAISTADLRRVLTGDFHVEMVQELVYRNLEILERRGEVVRVRTAGRHTLWRICIDAQPDAGAGNRRRRLS